MVSRMKFADLAKRANAAGQQPQSPPLLNKNNEEQPSEKNPEPPVNNFSTTNDSKPSYPTHSNDILKDTYFIPSSTTQCKSPLPLSPGEDDSNNRVQKMSGFSRMGSYNKNWSGVDRNCKASRPLLEPDTSTESESASDIVMTTRNSPENDEILHLDPNKPKEIKPKINPFAKRRPAENGGGILSGVQNAGANGGRRGVVIDPFEQSNLRSKLKSRLKSIVEERLTVKQIFRRYVEHSTLHGFLYTCSDTFIIRRFIWACLMILGAIYFLVKLKEGIIEYFEYPFSTLSTMDIVDQLPFPAVSFCLINSFKVAELKESKFKTLLDKGKFPLLHLWDDPGFDIPGDEMVEQLRNVSLSIDDIFEGCDWISRDTNHPFVTANTCEASNYTTYFNNEGQSCYTLNSGKEGHPLLSVTHQGLNYGYEVLFDMKTGSAFREYPFAGIKVVFHSQDEPPNMETGFILAPGFKYYIKMKMQEIINLPPPYGTECGEIELKYFKNYNQKACLLERLTDYVEARCGCREPFMAENNITLCSLKQTILCSYVARDEFDEYEERKECPTDCEVKHIHYDKTDARLLHNPPKGVEPILLRSQNDRKGKNTSHLLELTTSLTSDEMDHYVEDNLLKMIIFYGELQKEIHEQEATFDFYQFLGDMGGEIGLMLGASLLTFVEFVDLILFLIYHQVLRLHKRKKNEEIFEDDTDEEKE